MIIKFNEYIGLGNGQNINHNILSNTSFKDQSTSMRQLTIVSGAGINYGVADECPFADELINFTYQKISQSVYQRISPEIQAMFSQESFDYILGGLMTVNLAIERTKQDVKRFGMNTEAFSNLFRQTDLQNSIVGALDQIESQLTVSLQQMLQVVEHFSPAIDGLKNNYQSINYYTVNFDGIFDHIIYGKGYSRIGSTTDYWRGNGNLNKDAIAQFKIMHLHGDLRYKPFKKTKHNTPTYRWPVLVVGDGEVKKGIIASNEALRFYNQKLRDTFESREQTKENNLLILGFGFREEDDHIVAKIKSGIANGTFDNIVIYDHDDKLAGISRPYTWISPNNKGLKDLLESI